MRKGIGRALVVAVAFAVLPATASAGLLCVPSITIPACHGTGANEPTIQDAVNNGTNGDTVFIGAGTYNETVTDTGKHLTFVGADVGQTVIQAQGSPGFAVSAGSSVSDLTINLHNGSGETGLQLAGSATRVSVTATGANNQTNAIGVALSGGASFTHGSVVLPVLGTDANGYAGVIGNGTVSDSTIDAAVGAGLGVLSQTPSLVRDQMIANQGILIAAGSPEIDSTLIRTVAGSATELGVGGSQVCAAALRHVTLIGSGSAASTGVALEANGVTVPESNSLVLDSTIVRGYTRSVLATATPAIFSASATVTIQHSIFDPATEHASPPVTGPPSGSATIAADAASGNHDPLFVNAGNGDFNLQAGSPAIDAGSPALGTGESTTALDGTSRTLTGHRGDAPISDIGAYEFVAHPPTVSAHASATSARTGTAIRFTATGADVSPGDLVALGWQFDDGTSVSGAAVSHAFTRAGRHTATATATDLDGFTATATALVTVTVTPPPRPSLSHVSLRPSRFRARAGTTISYTDSQAATTTFVVLRGARKGKRVGLFSRHDRAGKNRLHFTARLNRKLLAPGNYRLAITPSTTAAGSGKTVTIRFTIRPPARHRGRPRR